MNQNELITESNLLSFLLPELIKAMKALELIRENKHVLDEMWITSEKQLDSYYKQESRRFLNECEDLCQK